MDMVGPSEENVQSICRPVVPYAVSSCSQVHRGHVDGSDESVEGVRASLVTFFCALYDQKMKG